MSDCCVYGKIDGVILLPEVNIFLTENLKLSLESLNSSRCYSFLCHGFFWGGRVFVVPLRQMLGAHGVDKPDVDFWALHPGGHRIVEVQFGFIFYCLFYRIGY